MTAQDRGFYVGGHIGQSKFESNCSFLSSSSTCDDKSTSWKVLSGYRFNRYFAAELSYTDLGEAKATGSGGSATATATATDLSVLAGFYPIEKLAVYGRLGAYLGEFDVRSNSTFASSTTTSQTNIELVYGLGVSYDITRQFTVRTEWQRYNQMGSSSLLGNGENISVIALGALFRF